MSAFQLRLVDNTLHINHSWQWLLASNALSQQPHWLRRTISSIWIRCPTNLWTLSSALRIRRSKESRFSASRSVWSEIRPIAQIALFKRSDNSLQEIVKQNQNGLKRWKWSLKMIELFAMITRQKTWSVQRSLAMIHCSPSVDWPSWQCYGR